MPDLEGLVVVLVDRDPETVLGKPHRDRQEFPGPGNRLVLEVVAEREIPQHLEEGVMAGRVADVLEVVVLASRADGFLGARRPFVAAVLDAEEAILELHHARVGEKKRRVVLGDERRTGHPGVAPLLKEFQKTFPDFTGLHRHESVPPENSPTLRRSDRGETPCASGSV